MTDEEIRARHAANVAEIKARIERAARVRAAAPQMLEALKICRKIMQNEWRDKPRIGMETECAIVDAAIAAAEGEP